MKDIIEVFFQNLWVKYDEFSIFEDQQWYIVKIKTQESGLLIWPQWKNLDAFQSILRQMLNNSSQSSQKVKLKLEINDYETSKDARLFQFIQSKIDEVKQTGKDFQLPYYSPYERKKIHNYVAELDQSDIFTKSIGEENQRRLYICKKAQKLTIDIDGDDI